MQNEKSKKRPGSLKAGLEVMRARFGGLYILHFAFCISPSEARRSIRT
jgi:hypothetical protein